MKTIKKLEFRMNTLKDQEASAIVNNLIDKINELTEIVNELNYTVGVLHDWKLQKEGI